MIIIDERKINNSTLMSIFEDLGYKTIFRKYSKAEIDMKLEAYRQECSLDENDEELDILREYLESNNFIDIDKMKELYLPQLAVVKTCERMDGLFIGTVYEHWDKADEFDLLGHKLKKVRIPTVRKEDVKPCDLVNIDKIICK